MVGQDNTDDIYQEVCLLIYQKMRTWQGRSKITDWIGRITVNTCINFLRKTKPNWLVMTDKLPEGETEPEQTSTIFTQAMVEIVHKALREMGETCKQLVTLHLFEGLEKKEIMAVVKLKKSAFYERWKECFNTLKRKIQKMIREEWKK
jgi:RNA polymerase sigma factor (sigma-70 family)